MLPIYLDLETIPGQGEHVMRLLAEQAEEEKAAVTAPGNYKDPIKIADYITAEHLKIDADFDQRYRKTALDGSLGQIAVASIAVGDHPPEAFYTEDWQGIDSERFQLERLYDAIEGAVRSAETSDIVFVGHNIVGFDLRFLFQRSVILEVPPPSVIPFGAKPWDGRVFDTMVAWSGDPRGYVSMDKVCNVLGIAGKGEAEGEDADISGAKVWDYVRDGKIAQVATYCNGDIVRTRGMHRRMAFLPLAA